MTRACLLLLSALPGCHGSGSGSGADAVTGAPLSCHSQQLCSGGGACDLTLTAAMNDAALCPASYEMCGNGWTIVTRGGVDTSTSYYYQDGNLVAVTSVLVPAPAQCTEGPASFSPPACGNATTPTPACP